MGNCVFWFWIRPPLCQTSRGYWAKAPPPQLSAASGNSLATWSTNSIRWWSHRTFCQPRRGRWDGSASLIIEPRTNLHGDLTLLIPVVISQMKISNSKILCAEKIPWKFIILSFQELFIVIKFCFLYLKTTLMCSFGLAWYSNSYLGCCRPEAGVKMSSRSKQVQWFGWRTGGSHMKSFESEAAALKQYYKNKKRLHLKSSLFFTALSWMLPVGKFEHQMKEDKILHPCWWVGNWLNDWLNVT